MSEVHAYVHKAYTETIFYTVTLLVFDMLREHGVNVMVGDDFKNWNGTPAPGDKLITYGNAEFALDVVARFAPQDRWNYVVDEAGAGQLAYERSMTYMKKVDIRNLVVTYQSPTHLERLRSAGYPYVIMPACVRSIRPRTEKPHDILMSGQQSDNVYPTRTRLSRLFARELAPHFKALPYPGCDTPQTTHKIYHQQFFDHMDGFKMAIACRAGSRDRFVAKYVEMAQSHVLPVGDCPTYMPKGMREAMINVEGMSDGEVVSEVTRLLHAPGELKDRADTFTQIVEELYLASPNMKRVLEEIKSH